MATPVILPRQGQSVETCLLLSWKKNEGDEVERGETLCEVETDKATFPVEAPETGTLLKQYYREGQDIPVLSVIAMLGQPGENAAQQPQGPTAASAAPAPQPPPQPAQPTPPPALDVRGSMEAGQPGHGAAISPRAARTAALLRVPTANLHGSGPGGRIMERDVLRVSSGAGPLPAPAPALGPQEQYSGNAVPVRGIRKLTAERMLESLRSTAQITLTSSADARELESLRARLKASPEEWGLRQVSITDLILLALSRLLVHHPEVNAHFLGDRIVRYPHVHLGLAVDTPRGLLVPVIRNAHQRTLREISTEARRVAAACRDGTIHPQEMGEATFTLSNLGALGVETFTPVVNPPEVAILGVGSIQLKPVRVQGAGAEMVPHLGLSLTVDHQAVDGAPAARFLAELAALLGSPIHALAL